MAIGQGQVRHAERYCGRLAPGIDCVTNEHERLYFRYGLSEDSYWEWFKKWGRSAFEVLRAMARKHRYGRPTGNVRMIPGTFIVDTGGVIRSLHYNKTAGDHPDIPAMLDAFRKQGA